jgi:hypothetical protein
MYHCITSDLKTSFFSSKELVTCYDIFKKYINDAGLETYN